MIRRMGLSVYVFLLFVLIGGPARSQDVPDALTDFPKAKVVIGQKNFKVGSCDRGKDNPSKKSLCDPEGAAAVSAKAFYIPDSDNARVLGLKSEPKKNGGSAKFVLGQTNFSSTNSGTSSTLFDFPAAVVVAGNQLFMTDFGNSRVLIWNSLPTKTNTPADVVVGQPDFASSAETTTQSSLNRPEAGLFVVSGKLLVSDRNNHRIMIWNTIPTTNGANADVVVGQPDFMSNTPDLTQTNLDEPEGLWSDGTKLAVADFMNNRVLIWNTIPTSNGAAADVVVGQADFMSNDNPEPPTAQSLTQPGAVASDGTRLFVEDSRNNRILVYNTFPTSNNAAADLVIGEPDLMHSDANGGSSTPTAQGLSFPFGMSIVGKQLIVDDDGNSRFLIFGI
jgi:hypothetical protein